MCHHVPVDAGRWTAEAQSDADVDEEPETVDEEPMSVPPAPP